jgi:L-seryl-tRNA(Ser) seleniumtransferase
VTSKPTQGDSNQATAALRQIPSVDELLNRPAVRVLEERVGRQLLVDTIRQVLAGFRNRLASGTVSAFSLEMVEKEIVTTAEAALDFSLRPVINASGVIIHTNLGRAPLAEEALEHLAAVARGYSNLEFDLARGERGKRDSHTDRLFARLLGAERTVVVNNNAAAVFLALNTLAEGGEVIVSRGELIEIGESFRIPDVCAKSGAVLREVGSTNRTRVGDYAAALNERTRVLMRVHPSNYRIVGFTERPELKELVELARQHHLLVVEDLGSGCLIDLTQHGVRDEPLAKTSLQAGVDVVTFSADKLLGGPQAGILTGQRAPLERIRKNPLFRALRVDKLTIAALEATLGLYLRGCHRAIPVLRLIELSPAEIGARATRLAQRISAQPGFSAQVEEGESVIGGGSTPGQSLPTRLVAVRHTTHSAQALEIILRQNSPPIMARVEADRLLLDLRTVFEDQDETVAQAFAQISS